MPRKHYSTEQIVTKLRQAEIELGRGVRTPQVCKKKLGISEQTYYRWRREYGGLRLDQAKRLKELERENTRLKRLVADQALDNAILKEVDVGKLLSPPRRRAAVVQVQRRLGVSERRACRVVGQPRGTQRQPPRVPAEAGPLMQRMTALASQYGRDGYRPVTALLRREGWRVNHKRVARLWRREGLKVPLKQPKRGRLWLTDGSGLRLRPTHRHHVWAYDFVSDRTRDGRPVKILAVVDEYSRECLALVVARHLRATDVLKTLADLFVVHGAPGHLRSDNGLPQKSRRQSFSDLTIGSVDSAARRQAGSTLAESHADHSHTGSRPHRPALTRLNRASYSRWKVQALSTRSHAPRRPVAKGSSRLVSSLPGSGDSRCRS